MGQQGYRELQVWQRSMELVVEAYRVTAQFPREEQYGLVSQMRRAAISMPSNIAEGSKRGSEKDYRNFLLKALSSGAELETQSDLSKRLEMTSSERFERMDTLLAECMRMLNSMVQSKANL